MDVILAGLNVDAELLREFPELLERARQALAPETAAADRAAGRTGLPDRSRNMEPAGAA